ncbi:hypothetical protein C8T65DRAFT_606962 [Cerioporus squamosus]|nr:hypothetical protein C8T65DRAFT_606962 [Cerioporus squamosus]
MNSSALGLIALFRNRGDPDWDVVTSHIRSDLNLPDFTTSLGLKQVALHFDRIYDMLEDLYLLARAHDSPQVMAGVAIIWIRMCADIVIREKMVDRALLDRVVALLNPKPTRRIALEMLLALTHYCSFSHSVFLEKVARKNGVLVQLLQDSDSDPTVAELIVVIMSHTIPTTVSSFPVDQSGDRAAAYSIHSVLQSTVALLRKPGTCTPSMLSHALSLLAIPAEEFPRQCKGVEPLPRLFVAFLRSKDVVARAVAMDALIDVSRAESERDRYAVDLSRVRDILAGTQELPEGLEVDEDWLTRSNAFDLYSSTVDYFTAISQLAMDRDFLEHGRRLADIVQRSPCAVEGEWRALEDDGEVAQSDRLPLRLWSDALVECARALRLTGAHGDRNAADILDMKYLLIRGRLLEAVALAKRVIAKNPNLVYAWYVVSLSGDTENGLHAAKEGLQCAGVTQFLRTQMLWRAVDLGVGRALSILTSCIGEDSPKRAEGTAILSVALQDTDTFIEETPGDAPLVLTVLGWRIILKLLLSGSDMSSNLHELRGTFRQIRTTVNLMKAMGYAINRSALYLTWSYVSDHYQEAEREWGALIQAYDRVDPNVGCPATYFSIGTDYPTRIHNAGAMVPRRREARRCARCGSPSASLKRCKGCMTARYCDPVCQRAHWLVHRETCSGRT